METKCGTAAATRPIIPALNIIGARARRYIAERSIKVRIVCRFSEAQLESINAYFALQSYHVKIGPEPEWGQQTTGAICLRTRPLLGSPADPQQTEIKFSTEPFVDTGEIAE